MDERTHEMMRGLRLLVVDDNSVNRTLLAALAANLGAECDTGRDGGEAISLALDHHYDCIILDLHMPEVDGYTAAKAILQLSDAPPLIAFSADHDEDTEAAIREAGFSGLLHKPLSEDRLAQMVTTVIGGGRATDEIDERFTEETEAAVYDYGAAMDAAGGNPDLAAELFRMLRHDLVLKRPLLDPLEGQRQQVIDLVHQIHGAASHCRAEALRRAAAQLETELRREDATTARDSLLAHRHRQLLAEIDTLLDLPDPFTAESQ